MDDLILYPAIDLKDGHCVRLYKGEMTQAKTFNDNPASQAKDFQDAGFSWLHLVDLNGAFEGKPVNGEAIKAIRQAITIPMQLGGGIRDMKTAEYWINLGVNRLILGTAAVKNPDFVKQACKAFPNQIAVGVDARGGMVATEGWAEQSDMPAIDLCKKFEDAGVCAIIYTDIDRDGALQGINVTETANLASAISIPVIASGGLTDYTDITALRAVQNTGIMGVISGKALYEGNIEATKALELCKIT
ncbi:MAG: phosphoribosylformimino-5-aminoimidazole carboxamide ribotide isomerase [Dasania sp.]|jgi:phosphoribosylformimino-5-aminoimidazole carboxamide ribotide isomerase